MKKALSMLILCVGILVLSMAWAPASDITVDEERLREIIEDVIRENPKLIYDTVNAYLRQQRAQMIDKQLDASFKNRINDVISANNPSKGPADAPITIIEYTDFECSFCARGANSVYSLMRRYPGKLKLVFKNNPLEIHAQAFPAAKAALAARNQGKFWEYHDLLFRNTKNLNEKLYLKLARDLKLDLARFNIDRNSDEIARQIAADKAQAKKLSFTSAPVFILNGVMVNGSLPLNYFVRIIERLLKEKKNN